jgi:hypothetical protein
LNGHSFRTEGVAPIGWTYMDGRYITSVHKRFGRVKITSFPILSLTRLVYYVLVKRIKFIHLLEYLDYRQKEVGKILTKEVGWKYYGGHHHESVYTHFFQSYLLPIKFGIDKRKLEYSALIRSGQMTRKAAIKEVAEIPYAYENEVVEYTVGKLGLTDREFDEICSAERKTFLDYPTYYPIIKIARIPIKIACSLKLLPPVLYEKYLGSGAKSN